jgi:hypothetical protein
LPKLVEKTIQLYVLLALVDYYFIIASFDMWMSKRAYDILSLAIFGGSLATKNIAIGCFEASDTSGHALANHLLTNLLNTYDLRKNINAHVKNEGSNLNTRTIVFNYVVSCKVLSFIKSFQASYFNHAFFKACQYVSIDEKVCKGLKYVICQNCPI